VTAQLGEAHARDDTWVFKAIKHDAYLLSQADTRARAAKMDLPNRAADWAARSMFATSS
jgi:hypothetical protein